MAKQEAMQPQVRPDYTTAQANFTGSFDSAALSPSALGEFGANLAMRASTALAERRGYQEGLNPSGDVLPPLTKADEAFANAYLAQSQNTLGLQASKLMQEGQTELAKAWRVTPELINSYAQNMSQGLGEILANAPTPVRGSLETQFGSSLIRTTGELNRKMISQQKTEALQQAKLFNNSQISTAFEAAKAGQLEDAQTVAQSIATRSQQMLDAGMISPLQHEANVKSSKIAYYTGLYSGQALQAFNAKKADEFLANLLSKKPSDLTTQEWEGVANNVLEQVAQAERFQSRRETTLYSEAQRKLYDGTLTTDDITQLEQETTSTSRFNTFMGQVAHSQRKGANSTTQTANIVANWPNSQVFATASKETKNNALVSAVQDIKQRAADQSIQMDDFSAEVEAMSTAGGEIPAFTARMNTAFTSGDPNLMMQYSQAYDALISSNPKVLYGINAQAQAMKTKFDQGMEQGKPPEIAAQEAVQIVQGKKQEQLDVNTALIKDWESNHASTVSQASSWVSKLVDFGAPIKNLPYFAEHAKGIMKRNMDLLNGDVAAAEKMTAEGLQKSWGITRLNGKEEAVFSPIEKVLNLDSGALPLVREDIYNQLLEQTQGQKEMFLKNNKDLRFQFYWDVDKRPSFEEYQKAKEMLAKSKSITPSSAFPTQVISKAIKGETKSPEITQALETIKAYESEQIGVRQVFRDGKQIKFNVNVEADPGLVQSDSGVIGNFNVMVRDQNNAQKPMAGFFNGPLISPIYRPNSQQIHERYIHLVGLNHNAVNPREIYARFSARQKALEEAGSQEGFSSLGRGFR